METKNLDIYGSDPIPWSRVLDQLETKQLMTHWLATTRPGGRPHVAGVGAKWIDGKFYFVSGPGTRKSRNLVENTNCVLAFSLPDIDVVIEGTAREVTDAEVFERVARRYAADEWPAEAREAPSASPARSPSARVAGVSRGGRRRSAFSAGRR